MARRALRIDLPATSPGRSVKKAGSRRRAASGGEARRHSAGCPFPRQSAQPSRTRIVAGRKWRLFPGSCGKSPVLVPVGSSRRQWCPCGPARPCEEACEAPADMLGRGSESAEAGACGETPGQTLAITANDRRGPRIAANRSAGLEWPGRADLLEKSSDRHGPNFRVHRFIVWNKLH